MIIDAHHHFIPEPLIPYLEKNGDRLNVKIVEREDGRAIVHGEGMVDTLYAGQYDPSVMKADMDKMHIDAAVLSNSPANMFFWSDEEAALEVSRICNDWAAELARKEPGRFYAMATVPMQNVELSVKELERAHTQLGINAVEIAPIINGEYLDEQKFFPFYSYCADNDILLYLHPQVMERQPFFEKYYNINLIGNVLHTNIGLNCLLFGGVFEKYPNLKVLASHGGGYFPYQFGRLMHGYDVRKEPCVNISQPPSTFLKNIYFDSITHWSDSLQFLVDTFGADHVVIGTDYPFDMGDWDPMANVDKLRITKAQRDMITSGTILSLL